MMYRWTFPVCATDPVRLRHLGAIRDENEGVLTVQDRNGHRRRVKAPITNHWY